MQRFRCSTHILPSAFWSFIMSLSGPQACSLLWWVMIFHFILLPVNDTAVQKWHAASMRTSLFSHDEFPVYSHFKFRWVYPPALYRDRSETGTISTPDAWWLTMSYGCVLRVRSVNRETCPVTLNSLILYWVRLILLIHCDDHEQKVCFQPLRL